MARVGPLLRAHEEDEPQAKFAMGLRQLVEQTVGEALSKMKISSV